MPKLTDAKVKGTVGPAKLSDGGGLWLYVLAPGKSDSKGTRRWVHRFMLNGKSREMGLGGYPVVTLAEARNVTLDNRRLLHRGIDPIEHRKAQKREQAMPTFEALSRETHQVRLPTWKNQKHGAQFISTLETYVFPMFGDRLVSEVRSDDVVKALEPIWTEKAETARRVKQRINVVMERAMALGLRPDNPVLAASAALPRIKKKVKRRVSLPYQQTNACLLAVQGSKAHPRTKLAFEFLLLTALRSGEVRLAEWSEFDLAQKLWTIPEGRMKAGEEHRVPLSRRALDVLKEAQALSDGSDLVFAGTKRARPLSDATLLKVVREQGFDVDIHGFRSTFRDWVSECTDTPREVAEMALAHSVGNAVEQAYARSDLLAKRRVLMEDWAAFVALEQTSTASQNDGTNNAA